MRSRGCSEPPFEGIDRCPGNATEVEDCKTSDCTGDISFVMEPTGYRPSGIPFNHTTSCCHKGGKRRLYDQLMAKRYLKVK